MKIKKKTALKKLKQLYTEERRERRAIDRILTLVYYLTYCEDPISPLEFMGSNSPVRWVVDWDISQIRKSPLGDDLKYHQEGKQRFYWM